MDNYIAFFALSTGFCFFYFNNHFSKTQTKQPISSKKGMGCFLYDINLVSHTPVRSFRQLLCKAIQSLFCCDLPGYSAF